MNKIICLGGSFNPIHHAHLLCARAVAEARGAQKIILIPSGQPPHKNDSDLAPPAGRLAMCRLAIEGTRDFEVDDRELHRPGPSYTIQTVRDFKSKGANAVAWIIGADMVANFPTWHESIQLLKEAELLVMARPGSEFRWNSLPPEFAALQKSVIEVPSIDISSTDIRRRVKAGQPIDFLTPPAVCRYIVERGLYR